MAAGHLLYEQARRLLTLGSLTEAQRLFEDVGTLARENGDEITAMVARGKIADILQSRCDLDEALRIRREEELPVYEKLKDLDGIIHCYPVHVVSHGLM